MFNLAPMMSEQDQHVLLDALKEQPVDGHIVEYGSGGSTCMFVGAMQPTQTLYSIEHNPAWFTKVQMAIGARPNVHQYLAPLLMPMERWRFAQPEEEMGACADEYIHPKMVPWEKVTMAFVDGIARGPVLACLRVKLAPGTPVFLHDYRGREEWYDWAIRLFDVISVADLTISMRVPR